MILAKQTKGLQEAGAPVICIMRSIATCMQSSMPRVPY